MNLGAIAWNVAALRRHLQLGTRLLVVVKANGYGHGAVAVARTAVCHGAYALGVSRIEEGVELREAGIDAPILIFGPTPGACVGELLHHRLTPSITGAEDAAVIAAGMPHGLRLAVHLKLDTGMGRLGCFAQPEGVSAVARRQTVAQEVAAVASQSQLFLQGIFTHFASADSPDKSQTVAQFKTFMAVLEAMARQGIRPPLRHAANSASIFNHPETHLDLVRAGIAVYGCGISDNTGLRPAMTLRTRVVQLKHVPAGTTVGYGMTHSTSGPTSIATVGIGYADGFDRAHSGKGRMLVRGQLAPIIGRVCMDLTMLDVGHIPDVAVGDEVVVFGRQGACELTADAVGATIGTIPHEVMSALTQRVRRVYVNDAAAAAAAA